MNSNTLDAMLLQSVHTRIEFEITNLKKEGIIIIIIIIVFSHQLTLMVFDWSLSDSKSPQVSRTLLSILSVLNNVVVWVVSTRLQITIGINLTPMFQSFFQFPSKVQVLILLFTFF